MTRNQKTPLEELFAQTPDELACRARRVALSEPKAAAAEHMVLQALLEPPEEEAVAARPSLWARVMALAMRSSLQWTAALVLIGVTGVWMVTPEAVMRPKTPPHRLIPKGGIAAKAKVAIALQVGVWQAHLRRIEPLRPHETLLSTQSVVFGLKVSKHTGYIYLFHQRRRQVEQIYPAPGALPQLRRPQRSVQLVQGSGAPQRYSFEREYGVQRFVVLFAKRPLTDNERKRWKQHFRQFLTPKRALPGGTTTLRKSIRLAKLHTVLYGHDIFALQVKGRQP